jgi:tetratricopeptide (TPR) repeat protein
VQNARLGGAWDRLEGEPYRHGIEEPRAIESYFLGKTLARAAHDPLGFAHTLGSKLLWLVQAEEVRDNHSLEFFRRQSAVLAWLPGFGLLLPLALCGAWSAWRAGRMPWMVVAYVALNAATAVLLLYGMRYRLPIVPGVAVFAGEGATALWRELRGLSRARWRQAAALLALAGAGALLAQARRHPADRNFAEEWALGGNALEEGGRLEEAGEAFGRAVAADPRSAVGWDGIGRVRILQQRWPEAEQALRKAIAVDPDYRRAHYHLALVDEHQGQLDPAERQLETALEISPRYPLGWEELGAVRLARGDLAGAEAAYRKGLALEPRAGTLLGLARLAGARGRRTEGIDLARRAVALDPEAAPAWSVLAALALESGDAGLAGEAVAELRRLEGDGAAEVLLLDAATDHLEHHYPAADAKLRRLLLSSPSAPAVQLFLRNAEAMGQRPAAELWLATLRRPA